MAKRQHLVTLEIQCRIKAGSGTSVAAKAQPWLRLVSLEGINLADASKYLSKFYDLADEIAKPEKEPKEIDPPLERNTADYIYCGYCPNDVYFLDRAGVTQHTITAHPGKEVVWRKHGEMLTPESTLQSQPITEASPTEGLATKK